MFTEIFDTLQIILLFLFGCNIDLILVNDHLSALEMIHLARYANFLENWHFLPPDTYT